MEMLSDSYTPVEVMKILRKVSRHCYLLESASQSEVWGRYSFLGYDPGMEITCLDDILTIRETMPDGVEQKTIKKIDHPGDVLREILDRYKTPQMEDMPSFTGGLVGYFSYDYIKYSEPKLKPLMKSRVKEARESGFQRHGPDAFRQSNSFRSLQAEAPADNRRDDRRYRNFI